MSITKEEYLRLIEEYVNGQYGDKEDEDIKTFWMPSEPEAKSKIKPPNFGPDDLTNAKSEMIKMVIKNKTNLRIGPFMIVSTGKYESKTGKTISSIYIYEDKPNSMMTNKLDVLKDDRFSSRPWAKLFDSGRRAKNISSDDLFDIVRWLQAVQKLAAFL